MAELHLPIYVDTDELVEQILKNEDFITVCRRDAVQDFATELIEWLSLKEYGAEVIKQIRWMLACD